MRVRNFGREAQTALESEAARLAAQPPPPATAATGEAPMDEGAAQNDSTLSGVVKRPRGNAPKGKVWSGGQWVDASAVAKAAGPSPAATLNRGGRPAKKAFGGCKRKAMASMVDKENIPVPQQQPEPHTGPVCPILRAKRSRTGRR